MENTLENKAKFISIYWGQNIFIPKNSIKAWRVPGFIDNAECDYSFDGHIILKPLSSLSDEDAVCVASIFDDLKPGESFHRGIDNVSFLNHNTTRIWFNGDIVYDAYDATNPLFVLRAYDFLRSKGYALPYNGLSVEKQIEYGWIKLTEPCEPTK